VSFGPGVTPRNHRTDSIDYATVISGEIDMELDGTSVHLKAGDMPLSAGSSVLDTLWIVAIILEQPAYALVVPSGQSALGCSFCCSRCCPE
jgi:hypothetical protein